MERRIKIVWGVSLLAMLLLIGGQGYWLRNQYQYVTNEQLEEVYQCILEAVQKNDSLRTDQQKSTGSVMSFFNLDMERDSTNEDVINNLVLGAISTKNTQLMQEEWQNRLLALDEDTVHISTGEGAKSIAPFKVVYKDTFQVTIPNFSKVNMSSVSALYRLEKEVPFTEQRFDSLLTSHIPELKFETRLEVTGDTTYQWDPIRKQMGTLLHPKLEVRYPYNPLMHQFVVVNAEIVPHTLLVRMGWQLLGSLLLILLLGLCLLFQVKTILKQRKIDELRKSFVNTMIHELKRPVQALKMCVAFLNDKTMRTDEQAMDEVVRDSLSELDNLSAYLSKLRDMTRADDARMSLSITVFDIRPLVEKVARLYHSFEGKEVFMKFHFSEKTQVMADPVHLVNIISNLLENAVKYSGDSVHIEVECLLRERTLILRVTDTGIGIPVSEHHRVFNKFYRGSNLPDRSLPGIGLGLSYIKLLVEAHHGTINLQSQLGEGTTIEITIPQPN